ncbi:MAG: amidohydrolase family protein [Pirellula sp.]|jgi:cytosine/adenosine deaminase-related metal-dependent hydrolase
MHDPIAIKPKWIFAASDHKRAVWPQTGLWVVMRSGRIEELAATKPLSIPSQDCLDRPDWILLPGFFNCHCHLEFSDLQSPFPASNSFAEWIGSVVRHRMQASGNRDVSRSQALRSGIVESWQTGTRFVFDTITAPWQSEWIRDSLDEIVGQLSPRAREICGETPIRVLPCVEVLDINQTRKEETWRFYNGLRSQCDSLGISPHAPYTTSNTFVKESVMLANQNDAVVSMHLAESKDEMNWLVNRLGPFDSRLAPFRDATYDLDRSVLSDYMQSLVEAERLLIAHGNYLTKSELALLSHKSTSAAIVHCPRTYRHFQLEGRDAYPIETRLEDGVQHFLGTDSRASNPDLSMWREFQCIAMETRNDVSMLERVLRMLTIAPAKFFRQADLGSIQPGAAALLNCIANPGGWPDTPEELLVSIASTSMHPSPLELCLN